MEFRILGPLEVRDGNRALPLRGRRQRALLAILLLNANEVVSGERLLDDLWGDEPPKSGTMALRVRVSQLRKALQQNGGDGILVTREPGYLLRLGPDDLDAVRFERLLAAGRQRLADGDAARAAATLREALALWRGPALADLAYEPFAQAEIGRLEELRLVALEERVEADLASGRHPDLVGELEALVAENPFRERLCAQLMLALYRSGRQAEALAAYRAARRVLVDELGLEPSRALQDVEQAILRHDPALDPARAAPSPAPAAAAPPRDAERKLVTLLVAELDASPELDPDPERGGALLDRFHELAAAEIEAGGGRMEAFVCCFLTAVFGAPVAQEDHAERALHAALAMRRRAAELFGESVPLRIGVDSGEAVVGRPRAGGSSVESAAVTRAVRLQQAAQTGEILVGERAAAAAGAGFEFGPGRDAARPLRRALSATKAVRTSFVGRDRELELLLTTYRRAAEERRPHLVTVVGDAGVGKSRLVRELWERLAAEAPEPIRRTGRCLAYGHGTTYRPLADVLREELGLLETDDPEIVRSRLRGREILGLTLGVEVAADLHPLAARERLHEAWADLVGELVAAQPVVLLVEDVHWAQEPLLELLERLLEDVAGPLLVVATGRPELLDAYPAWGRRRDAATVWLEPLAAAAAERMLDDLQGGALSADLRRLVLERAEGNPFFLEELVSSLRDGDRPVPDSIQAVLAARIDLLPPVEKAALQAASVIGRVFWRGPLRELLDGVAPEFAVLEARDFIRRRSGSALAGEREYAFKHALTRDVAYASLPAARRARLHAAFAGWLEGTGGGRDEHAAFLAHHYAEAVRPGEADLAWEGAPDEFERLRANAIAWLRRAGDLALGRYELDAGVALFERALELESTDEGRSELWASLGRAAALRYDGEAFWTAMQKAIALCSDRETLADLYAELSFATAGQAGMWRRRPDRDLVDSWIDRALELAAPWSAARAKALIARCVWAPAGSNDAACEASEIAERLGDPELRSHAWDARGIAAFVAGEEELGRAWAERRFELLDSISDPDHVADIYYAPVTGCVWLGYFREARRLARRHDEIVSGLTPHHRIHGVAVLLEVEELAGAWDAVLELEERAEKTVLADFDTPCVRSPRSLLVCALANANSGDLARAARLEELADEFGMEGYGHVLDSPRIRLSLVRGDLDRVERLLAEPLPDRGWHRGWLLLSTHATRLDALAAVGGREEIESWPVPAPGTYLDPFLLRARGIVHEEPELLERAAAAFASLGLSWHADQTRALH